MSQHLWMYEGGTEYFANLFQIQEGLINKDEFLKRIGEKIMNSKNYNDTMPFTVMSKMYCRSNTRINTETYMKRSSSGDVYGY